ncbi:ABC transporter permease [Neobacillus sp. LXY-1]|uniref:ABC transporter permease n=1 Tax=Neobacillus sp. LXY-1 TaxID=3379133 RepID=UPI003EE35C9F
MLNLIKLELKKNKLGWFFKGIILANLIILGLLCMIPAIEKSEGDQTLNSFTDYFTLSGAMVRGTMIVFAAVLISKIIIDEFKNRTHLVLFSYPVNRKKILTAKLILIFTLTLFTMVISNLFVIHALMGMNQILHLTSVMSFTVTDYFAEIVKLLMFNLATAGAALVPLYFGMKKYSTPATIVSSILIVFVTSSTGSGISLASIIYIPLALALMALGIVFLAIRNIERIDLN